MDYKAEIEYRNELINRAAGGEKLSKEEHYWLVTNRAFNFKYGYPYLISDIIQLQPNMKYKIKMCVLKLDYDNEIGPKIAVPTKDGSFEINDGVLYDLDMNPQQAATTKAIIFSVSDETWCKTVDFKSKSGLFKVSYWVDCFEPQMGFVIRRDASVGGNSCCMIKVSEEENKLVYECKHPEDINRNCMVFSIEWDIVDGVK